MNIFKITAIAAHKLLGGNRLARNSYEKTLENHKLLFHVDSDALARSVRDFAVFSSALMISILPASVISALFFYRDFETPEKMLFALISVALFYTWLCVDAGKARAANEIMGMKGRDNEQQH